MISKETFVKIIKNIQEQDQIDNSFGKALETVCDSYCIYGTKNKIYSSLFILLQEIFNDKDAYISWWIYEDVEKVVYINKKKKSLKTPQRLYDFLIENMKEVKCENRKNK